MHVFLRFITGEIIQSRSSKSFLSILTKFRKPCGSSSASSLLSAWYSLCSLRRPNQGLATFPFVFYGFSNDMQLSSIVHKRLVCIRNCRLTLWKCKQRKIWREILMNFRSDKSYRVNESDEKSLSEVRSVKSHHVFIAWG